VQGLMKDYRVLVTGSRDWPLAIAVYSTLNIVASLVAPYYDSLTVVHGDCPTGADRMADSWVAQQQDRPDLEVWASRHPADWANLGRGAGFARNSYMVSEGADQCIAFIKNKSRGATHCSQQAAKAGIHTEVYSL
jgi:hypothetical protein